MTLEGVPPYVYDNVTEIDGPPRTYFDIPTGPEIAETDVHPPKLRIVYREVRFRSKDLLQLSRVWQDHRLALCAELDRIGGGVIWWRIHPEITEQSRLCEGGSPGYAFYARLETSPALPDEFWRGLHWLEDPRAASELIDDGRPS